jgi:hypothetical protein
MRQSRSGSVCGPVTTEIGIPFPLHFRISARVKGYCAFALVVGLLCSGCPGNSSLHESVGAEQKLRVLETSLEAVTTTRIELFYLRADLETPVSITPADLERDFSYRLSLGLTGTQKMTTSVRAALRATKVYDSTDNPAVRLGMVSYRSDGSRTVSIFFSPDCKQGFVDNSPVRFRGDLCSWMKSAMSGVH